MQRELELVVWGATGFTGRLVAEALAERVRAGDGLRWGIGGRSRSKLEAVRAGLGLADLPLLEADAMDRPSLEALCERTQAVVTTVGPYARFGSELVAACARTGTHYADLTGEPQWIRRMIDAHQATAQATGARIVHCCGFDSIPSDLGVWVLQQEVRARHGAPCHTVKLRVASMRGGVSGGTAASALEVAREARQDREVRRVLTAPYSLNPPEHAAGPDRREPLGPAHDPDFGWTAPFVMGGVNTKIVRRTNALLDFPYGRDFRYDEAVLTGRGLRGRLKATGLAVGIGGFLAACALPPTRALLERFVLPAPGEGPGPEQREQGSFRLELLGRGQSGAGPFEQRLTVRGRRDPGYGATARMLAAAGLCLAKDDLEVGGGSWTPASALAAPLRERLRAAEVTFEPA